MKPKTIFEDLSSKKIEEPIVNTKKVTPSVLFTGNVIAKAEKATNNGPSPLFKDTYLRSRPTIKLQELKSQYSKIDDIVLNQALELILTTNCDQVNQKTIINWGFSAQESYARLIEKIASISNSTLLEATKKLINEIGALIETNTKTIGIIKKLLKRTSTENVYQKIVIKNELLKKNVIMLHNLLDIVAKSEKDAVSLENEIMVNIIAGNYLIQLIGAEYKDAFQTRITSLESLNIQFKVTKKQLELLNDTIIKIISIIQDTLAVEVPMWYNNAAFEKLSETQKIEILNKIKL